MQKSNIAWTHSTWNPWVGCTKVGPECAKCYIGREIRKQTDWQAKKTTKDETGKWVIETPMRQPWGEVYLTKTWNDPYKWQKELRGTNEAKRVFTCSLSDFFIAKVDNRLLAPSAAEMLPQHRTVAQQVKQSLGDMSHPVYGPNWRGWYEMTWRECAWRVIRDTPNLIYLILTKRPELIISRLPNDWGEGYKNVWLGTSVGCNMTLSKLDSLRKVPVHPEAVRFISCEPLLEDISERINLDGLGWVIAGGESGTNPEYQWDPQGDWRKEMNSGEEGHRTMRNQWAWNLYMKSMYAGIPFFFKQVSATKSEQGADALGEIIHQMPSPPKGLVWSPTKEEKELAAIQ